MAGRGARQLRRLPDGGVPPAGDHGDGPGSSGGGKGGDRAALPQDRPSGTSTEAPNRASGLLGRAAVVPTAARYPAVGIRALEAVRRALSPGVTGAARTVAA